MCALRGGSARLPALSSGTQPQVWRGRPGPEGWGGRLGTPEQHEESTGGTFICLNILGGA